MALCGAALAHPYHPQAVYAGYAPAFGYARTALDSTPYFVGQAVATPAPQPAVQYAAAAPYWPGFYQPFAPVAVAAPSLAVRAPVIAATSPIGTAAALPFLPVTSVPAPTAGLKETIAAIAEVKPSEPDAVIVDENTNPDENAESAVVGAAPTFALRRLVPLFTNSLRSDTILFATPDEAKVELPEDAGEGVVVADFDAAQSRTATFGLPAFF